MITQRGGDEGRVPGQECGHQVFNQFVQLPSLGRLYRTDPFPSPVRLEFIGNHEWVLLGLLGWLDTGAQGWADPPLRSAQDALNGRPDLGLWSLSSESGHTPELAPPGSRALASRKGRSQRQ